MKVLVLFFSFFILLQADVILVKSLACNDIEKLENIPGDVLKDSIKLNIYAMSNDCALLSKQDKIQAHEYTTENKSDKFIKIYLQDSGRILFINRKNIQIEQPGSGTFTYSR